MENDYISRGNIPGTYLAVLHLKLYFLMPLIFFLDK